MANDIIVKTFKYKIRATAKFTAAAARALDASRDVYNAALEQRITRYRQGKPIGAFEQSRELTAARELPWVGSTLRAIQQDALQRLDHAFHDFFRRHESGEVPGFPRFKGSRRYKMFGQQIERCRRCPLVGDILTIPGVCSVRVRLSRPVGGRVKYLLITHRPDGWYALMICELPKPESLPETGASIGIDVGLTAFATLSNGETIENPRHLRRAAKALKRSHQALNRKKKRSANRVKAIRRLSLRYSKVSRSRTDFHHKTALDLIRRFDSIKVEDLRIPNLLKNHHLARSIADAGWGQFLAITQFKAENAGRVFEKVESRYTSQTCSACGHRQKMPLSVRLFVCESCTHTLGRDHNAAINIRASGPKFTPAERLKQTPHGSRNRHSVKSA